MRCARPARSISRSQERAKSCSGTCRPWRATCERALRTVSGFALSISEAAAYAGKHELHALLVERAGEIVFERYGIAYGPDVAHALYSGTKSFWGPLATAAAEDGLLDLDEPVGATFAAWRSGERAHVTLRMLLSLTSGLGFGGLGSAVPAYEKALATPLKTAPGTTFAYGGVPLQVFGAVLAEKLRARGAGPATPHAYLRERLLDPIGCEIAAWRSLRDGTQPLPTGASLSARAWLTYGRFVLDRGVARGRALVTPAALAACFVGTTANPRYGLGWWLRPAPDLPDLAYASGAGGQALYVVPAHATVVVKFGASASFSHATFARRLFA